MKQQGVDQIGKAIDRNVAQACLLGRLVSEHPLLELLAPVDLNIVCFRYKSADLENDKMNDLNQEVLLRIQESGYAVPSQTIIQGKFAIRACITNHRTTDEDIHGLVQSVVQFGNLVEQETSTAAQDRY